MRARTFRRSTLLVLLATACGGTIVPAPDDEQEGDGDTNEELNGRPRPIGVGDGDDVGYGGSFGSGTGGATVIYGSGASMPGTGGAPNGTGAVVGGGGVGLGGEGVGGRPGPVICDMASDGLGTVGNWQGYFFTAVESGSTIYPDEFTGYEICAAGKLGASYEQWAGIFWNIAQAVDPVTFAGLDPEAINPGGAGVEVDVRNFGGSPLRVVLLSDELGSASWCAPLPTDGSTIIPWSSFTEHCWSPGGAVYDGVTPITQIAIQAFATSDTVPTPFDYCVVHLGPLAL